MAIEGFGEDGTRFLVPNVQSELEGMMPWNITIFEGVAWILCITSAILTFLFDIPICYYIGFYFIFRCSYNFGLAILLTRQSKHKSFTRVFF